MEVEGLLMLDGENQGRGDYSLRCWVRDGMGRRWGVFGGTRGVSTWVGRVCFILFIFNLINRINIYYLIKVKKSI